MIKQNCWETINQSTKKEMYLHDNINSSLWQIFLPIAKMITINIVSLNFSKIPSASTTLSRRLLFHISTLPPIDPASINFIRCSESFYYSFFSRSQQPPSWLFFWNTLRNHGISANLMLSWMLLNPPASNRISYWTYNLCSTVLLFWPKQYTNGLIQTKPLWSYLIPPALKRVTESWIREVQIGTILSTPLLWKSDHARLLPCWNQ